MLIEESGLYNTKMWVPRCDANAVQRALLNVEDFGYELSLGKSKIKNSFSKKLKYVAFFIDFNGFIEVIEVTPEDEEDAYAEYRDYHEEEINYEVVL